MNRFLTIATLLLIAGCAQQKDSNAPTSNDAEAAPAETAAATVPALEGEWQVAKVDGRPVGPGSAMVAAFGDDKVRIAAGCSHRAWTFTQKRNIVSFSADPGGSANCENPPNSDQEAAIHALDRATMAIFDKDGREANLSGNGGNVTLVRR
jgi:hypothetical protein